MGKQVHKYHSSKGTFICTYKSIQQAATDISCDESSIRKQVNSKDVSYVKGYLFSLRRCDNILEGLEYIEMDETPKLKHTANILIVDIETSPTLAYVWGLWKQNVGLNQIMEDSFIISYACKWLLEKEVHSSALTTQEAILQDDSRLLEELWALLNSADVVIAHNASGFDIPKINTRFIYHGLMPTKSYQVIDTLEVCRKNFRFTSNKLDYVTQYLGLSGKTEHQGFEMWTKCIQGNVEALEEMERYNRNDVVILENLFMLLQPWIKNGPNMGLYTYNEELKTCPACGSSDVHEDGYYMTQVSKYPEYRCDSCGHRSRSRFADKRSKQLLTSIGR